MVSSKKLNDLTPIKLNLGCGLDKRPGFINLDVVEDVEPDVLHDLSEPLPFKNATVDEVLAQDILEHFTFEEVDKVLAEISRVLRIGGKLTIRVPNVEQIIRQFEDEPEVRNLFLYGNTEHTGVFGAHKVGFTPAVLITKLLKLDIHVLDFQKESTNFMVTAEKREPQKWLSSVAFINQTFGMGGAEQFNADLLSALQKQGVSVKAYVTHAPFAKLLQSMKVPVEHVSLVMDIIGDWKGLLKSVVLFPFICLQYGLLVWKVRKDDVILLTGFPEKTIVSWWADVLDRPVVWVEFGPLSSVFKKFFRFPKLFYRTATDIPEVVIVPSENTRNDLTTSARIATTKFQFIPCGREITLPQNIKKKPHHIVCVSRFEKGKGQDLLVQAFAKVSEKFPQSTLTFVGVGAFQTEVKKLVTELSLTKQVKFANWVADPVTIMATAEVCVFPSVWELEGFGLVQIEAMALGKPVVGFNTGPTPEIIQHGKNGLLAKAGDIDDLAKQIIRLFEDPVLQKKVATQGKKDFQEKYTISKVAEQYREQLEYAVIKHKARQMAEEFNL